MKKTFTIIFVCLLWLGSYGQFIKASIGAGSLPNRVKIYLQPDITESPSSISTLQFNIGLDTTGLSTVPDLTVISSAFPSVTWQVEKHNDGGYWNYNIFTASSPLTPNLTANTEFEAMELEFSNGSPAMDSVALVTLPDGGASPSNSLFYCTGTVSSNGLSNLYYARSGVMVNNQNSYDPAFVIPGSATSTAFISSVALPLQLTGFNAVKKDRNALLTWTIQNQDANSSHFEIERSFTGTDFNYVGTVDVNLATSVYNFTDANITSQKTSGFIFYRIKSVDKDGRIIYSQVRNIKVNNKVFEVNLYPNPAKTNTVATINLDEAAPVYINISDAAGKQIKMIEIAGVKGANVKKIDLSGLASGSYMIKVKSGGQFQTVPLVKE